MAAWHHSLVYTLLYSADTNDLSSISKEPFTGDACKERHLQRLLRWQQLLIQLVGRALLTCGMGASAQAAVSAPQ